MSTHDDGTELEFFDEPETLEAPDRTRRRMRPSRPGGPRRPSPPPPGAVALARLAGFVALAIVVVVGLVFWVGSCQGKTTHDEYASYMNDVKPIAQSSAATGTAFANELAASKLTLAGLQSKLATWSHEQQELYNSALRLRPPGPLQAPNQQVLGALQLRAIAFADLANTVAVSGSKSTTTVADRLAQQAQQLTASDIVWANLFRLPSTQTMTRLGVKGVIAPPSVIVPNSEVISPHAFNEVYGRLKASSTPANKVTGLHGSELVSTEAAAGGSTTPLSASTATTVNYTSDLQFKVTFRNAGNFEEFNIPVTLTVDVIGKSLPVFHKTQKVASIQKGATQTVSFTNLNLPTSAFGNNATVHVEVGKVPGETNVSNNKAVYQVFFSIGSGG